MTPYTNNLKQILIFKKRKGIVYTYTYAKIKFQTYRIIDL